MEKIGNVLINLMAEISERSTAEKVEVELNRDLCSPQSFRQLFKYYKRGTVLEEVKLDIETFRTEMNCVCGYKENVEPEEHKGYKKCPECGRMAGIEDDGYRVSSAGETKKPDN